MKTNGIPSQLKQGWEQANVTFGKAQAVRAAIDNGGVANGVCEGIKQFCGDKPNIIAQGLVKIKDSKIGKFLIKNMFKIQFNNSGDSLELREGDLAKATGQEGQLGGFLLQLVDRNGWLSKLTSNICNKTSKFISGNLEKLIDKIPNNNIRKGIKDILGQVDSSNSKARERKANKEAQKEEYNKIKENIEKNNNITLEDLNDIIEDSEVSLSDLLKDKIYMVWAQNHTDCGEGDKQDILDALSNKGKRNLGINDNLTKKQKIDAETKAIKKLFTKNSSDIRKLIDT